MRLSNSIKNGLKGNLLDSEKNYHILNNFFNFKFA